MLILLISLIQGNIYKDNYINTEKHILKIIRTLYKLIIIIKMI